jgi:fructose-1-phosphate kinase PfkB-like protein
MLLVFAPRPTLERVALVEEFQAGPGPQKPMRVTTFAGGAGLRAATVARLLGADVRALGFVGGRLGELLRDGLDRQDVPHVLTPAAANTRGGFTLLDKDKGVISEVPEPPPAHTEAEAQVLLNSLGRHLPDARMLLVGDDGQGEEDDPTLFARAFEAAKATGVPVLADVEGSALTAAVEAGVWMVRVGLKTLQRRTERSLQHDSAIIAEARAWTAAGVENVVVTLGEEGALLVTGERAWRVKAPVVSHFNPSGSAEAFCGALAARYLATGDLFEAARYGCAAASVNVSHDEPGYATPGEVGVLFPNTTVAPVLVRARD